MHIHELCYAGKFRIGPAQKHRIYSSIHRSQIDGGYPAVNFETDQPEEVISMEKVHHPCEALSKSGLIQVGLRSEISEAHVHQDIEIL